MATVTATGLAEAQEVFEPLMPGFVHAGVDDISNLIELVEKYESLISELTTIEKQAALVRNRIASLMGGED